MGLSRSGTLFLIGLLVLIGLSLHPVAGVEAVVDRLFLPSRFLSELALPFRWLGAGSVRAAEAESTSALAAERERSHALLLASQSAAMPADASLLSGRALVGAHVIGRPDKMRDRLRLRFPIDAGVAPGMPVVCGDVFVGRVAQLDPLHPGECIADLVTARGFRVGAAVEGSLAVESAASGPEKSVADKKSTVTPRFVVGGILGDAKDRLAGLRLAALYPNDRTAKSGDLRVSEDVASADARLADGFKLGRLEPVELRGVEILGVRPLLDYVSGINHVAIVCPPQMATAGPVLALDPFDEAAWIDARVLLAGDASLRRSTRKLALRGASRVRPGAAIAIGARFVGRIERVTVFGADARLLADDGTSFHALARATGFEAPIVLGRLVSRGPDGRGSVLLEWQAAIPLPGDGAASVPAELWTASGESDVPPGLLVGTTELPRGRGPFVLRVALAQDAHAALRVKVWRGRESTGKQP